MHKEIVGTEAASVAILIQSVCQESRADLCGGGGIGCPVVTSASGRMRVFCACLHPKCSSLSP